MSRKTNAQLNAEIEALRKANDDLRQENASLKDSVARVTESREVWKRRAFEWRDYARRPQGRPAAEPSEKPVVTGPVVDAETFGKCKSRGEFVSLYCSLYGVKSVPAAAVRAFEEAVPVAHCTYCNGTGVYAHGTSKAGVCYQCQGKGGQSISDVHRNLAYAAHNCQR